MPEAAFEELTPDEQNRYLRFMALKGDTKRIRAQLNRLTRPIWKLKAKEEMARQYATRFTYDGAIAISEEVFARLTEILGVET